jgi:hypothetical protein
MKLWTGVSTSKNAPTTTTTTPVLYCVPWENVSQRGHNKESKDNEPPIKELLSTIYNISTTQSSRVYMYFSINILNII